MHNVLSQLRKILELHVVIFSYSGIVIFYALIYGLLCVQGMSGQPLSGPDIGGFAGNATPKLFGRWMGIGAMFPFCRGHSETGTTDHEPWSFGEEVYPKLCLSVEQFDNNLLSDCKTECVGYFN